MRSWLSTTRNEATANNDAKDVEGSGFVDIRVYLEVIADAIMSYRPSESPQSI